MTEYKLPEPALPNPGGFQDLYTADQLREEVAKAEQRGREAMREECPHGVDDGACKECYRDAVEPVAYWDGGDYVSLSNEGDAKIPLYTKEST